MSADFYDAFTYALNAMTKKADRILVFYAGLLYADTDMAELKLLHTTCGSEIYNGAYQYWVGSHDSRAWYRMDGTPVLLDDVPKELRMLVLLMT